MDELLGRSLIFIYILSVVTVINYGKLNSKQKMSVLHILTYGIAFNFVNSNRSIWMLVLSFFCAIFMYEEYWNCDEYKNILIKRFKYKIADFIYYFVFIYKGLFVLASLFVLANNKIFEESTCLPRSVFVGTSGFLLVLAIHEMFSNRVEHFTYTEIMRKIEKDHPYNTMVNDLQSGELDKRMRLLTDIEDHSFFERSTYTSFSWEYILIHFKRNRNTQRRKKRLIPRLKCLWRCNKGLVSKIRLLSGLSKRILHYAMDILMNKASMIKQLIKGVFSRGHSTIEMQLFRTLSFKRGIRIGKPTGIREFYYMLLRKVYEVIFTRVFFEGMKRYFMDNGFVEFKWFRQYIVYLYMRIVIAWYNGERQMPMSRLFDNAPISTWDMEKLFIECLGLSCKSKISSSRVMRYNSTIEKFDLDKNRINSLLGE